MSLLLQTKEPVGCHSLVDLSDVGRLWPERYGHLLRIAGVVEEVWGSFQQPVRVEVVDRLRGRAGGVYNPGLGLVELNSYAPELMASTLVHELGHHVSSFGCLTEWMFVRSLDKAWCAAVRRSEHYQEVEKDEYLGDWREVYARWFFQKTAVVSGDKTLLLQLNELRSQGYQWGEEDFSPLLAF